MRGDHSSGMKYSNMMLLLDKTVSEIPALSTVSQKFELSITELGTYVYPKVHRRIHLDVHYESDFHKKDVEQMLRQEKYALKTDVYEVRQGNVLRVKYTKKYRFESVPPFEAAHKTCRLEVVGCEE